MGSETRVCYVLSRDLSENWESGERTVTHRFLDYKRGT